MWVWAWCVSRRFGWNVTSIVLVGICILGIVAAILARPLWQKFKQ